MEPMSFAVVLVGSNALLREGLARILTTADFKVAASRACVDDHVVSLLTPDNGILLIIDVGDEFDAAIEQIAYFKRQCPAGRVVVLAHQHQFAEMMSAFRAGANAYFVKITTCEVFIKSIELVMLGETVLPPAILTIFDHERDGLDSHRTCYNDAARSEDNRPPQYRLRDNDCDAFEDDGAVLQALPLASGSCAPRLSVRHKSILSCLMEGNSNKIIARKMNIAEATVKVHVKAILRRIHVHNRTQAAIWAMNSGLFHSAEDADRSGVAHATTSDLDVADVFSSGLASGSSPAAEHKRARHGMLPNLDLLLRNGAHRSGH